MQEMREGQDVTFDGSPEARERAVEDFERHVREVEGRIPPERLLVYEVKQGWGPCASSLASRRRRWSRSRTSTRASSSPS